MKNASTLLLKQSFKFCSTYGVCAKTFVLITDLSDYNVDSVKYRLIIINFQYFQRFVSNFIGSQKLYMASGVLDVIDNEGIFLCPRSRVHHEPSKGALSNIRVLSKIREILWKMSSYDGNQETI